MLKLVEAAAPDCTRKQHSTTLQRLWASVQEGRQLVCWLRSATPSLVHVCHSYAAPHTFLLS